MLPLLIAALVSHGSLIARAAEVQITLFGAPCLLQGPTEEKTLLAIHAISPDQITPDDPETQGKGILKALDHLKKEKSPHPSLDRYREKLTVRFEAQLAFWNAFETANKTKKWDALNKTLKAFVPPTKETALNTALKSLSTANFKTAEGKELLHTAYAAYGDLIEPDPEEEFHRALRKLKIQYHCAYDGSGGGDSGAEPSAQKPPAQP